MRGWKTWTAVVALVLLAVIDVANGDVDPAVTKAVQALGILGLGHKIEKSAQGGAH